MRGKSSDNTYAAGEWFDRLLPRVQDRVREVGFDHFVDTLPRMQGRIVLTSIMALMERWMDTTHIFHLSFGEMTITPVDFVAITRLPFKGRSVIFYD
ncbi:hypothetical protein JCGZ_00105 [Jatropha curcas]|uniref:Aminotransferase-like plant mobile domain-containing protein n=1 Tax=Jatropha curcas TaxID=180498 RepID=A0A067JWB3_JATCU|nr:hypothetical protein JCGZ_00105 [Jatropha curcas]